MCIRDRLNDLERCDGVELADGDLNRVRAANRARSHRLQQGAHHADIENVRNVVDGVGAFGQDGGGHEFQDRVLRTADCDGSLKRSSGLDNEFGGGVLAHRMPVLPE